MAKKSGRDEEKSEKEGRNLLGSPTFKKLDNGRFICLETGHELPDQARDPYAQSKHCRLGLIDAAMSLNIPPLNMFTQDPTSRSKLICKLTGVTINKNEEHIWKHINGKRFLNKLEQKEAEELTPNGMVEEQSKQIQQKISKPKADGLKKKKKKKQKQLEENIDKLVSEVRKFSDQDSDSEEDGFWMPPKGERWDFDNGEDRWGSDSESGLETEDAEGADAATDEGAVTEEGIQDAEELSKGTKRMSIEIGPSNFVSRKKKKKTKSTL